MGRAPATARIDRIARWLVLVPLVCWLLAVGMTLTLSLAGCQIDEGSAHSCRLAGIELADFAYTTGLFAAWGGLIVLPISVGFAMLWGMVRLMLLFILPRNAPTEEP